MQIVIDIPDEQVKKSLEESKSIHENEGEKGHVDIMMLYTNGRLDFVDVSRKTDFYSCEYKILPKGHGRLCDLDAALKCVNDDSVEDCDAKWQAIGLFEWAMAKRVVIEADKAESEGEE